MGRAQTCHRELKANISQIIICETPGFITIQAKFIEPTGKEDQITRNSGKML